MDKFIIISLFLCDYSVSVHIGQSRNRTDHCVQPLFLTPFIEKHQIKEARIASRVVPLVDNITSFSGYLTVNKKYNSNIFFWYFKSGKQPEKSPVILWLEGGPGMSSLWGLFDGNGPYYIDINGEVKKRSSSWSEDHHVIYVDNPVGTGYSFTDNDEGYCQSQKCIGDQLYKAVLQFFNLFPELIRNDFYISGDSYGCKYAFSLGHFINKNNPTSSLKINMKGIAISNGICDPINQVGIGDYLYKLGLVDVENKELIDNREQEIVNLIKQEKWLEGYEASLRLMSTSYKKLSVFEKVTGFSVYFNILRHQKYYLSKRLDNIFNFVVKDSVRQKIHVGGSAYTSGLNVLNHLKKDYLQSVAPWIEELANKYDIIFYNGQLDIITAYPLTVKFIERLKWCGSDEYLKAARRKWYVNLDIDGYIKKSSPRNCSGSLTEVLVKNTGDYPPEDHPTWAKKLITMFTYNDPRNERTSF